MFIEIILHFKKKDDCKELFCKGKVKFEKEKTVWIETHYNACSEAAPCNICGRLHGRSGGAINYYERRKGSAKVFLFSGNVVHKFE